MSDWQNQLYFGDNLAILQSGAIPVGSVDLVYLDPPFNSNATYNILFAEKTGEKSHAQITAFEDTWHWGEEAAFAYDDVLRHGPPKLAALLQALRAFLGQNDMMAYLAMMAVRLVELHRVLKPTGSLYLHCDPTASHYIKLLLDAIFSPANYRTEIIWKRSTAHSDTKQGRKLHGRIHDVIFFYTKSNKWHWNPIYLSYGSEYMDTHYRYVEKETGRRYDLGDLTAPGGAEKGNPFYEFMGISKFWRYKREKIEELLEKGQIIQPRPGAIPRQKRYLDEMPGIPIQDIWDNIPPINAVAKERLGYPTQKPEALLERISAVRLTD